MLARLEAAFAAQRRFVADASHEIRHPLAVLRAGLELALRRDRAPDEYRAALADGIAEADRVGELAAGLLLLARSDAGVLQPRRVPTDVEALTAAACLRAAKVGEARAVRVALVPGAAPERPEAAGDAADGPPVVAAVDAVLVSQALDNLLDNAVRVSPAGGGVRVHLTRSPTTVAVHVVDSGPGVAPEHRTRLFERFFRADPARASGGGAGLGLAIVKGIAEAHGGDVTYAPATTPTGAVAGSRFTLRLPI
ncbi:sensor histidine kinase [Roseisolibacter agri]